MDLDHLGARAVPSRSIAATLIALACLGLGPGKAEASSLDDAATRTVPAPPLARSAAGVEDADGTVSKARPGLVWRWEAAREAPGVVLAFRHQVSAQSRLTLDTRWPGGGDAAAGQARRMAFDLGLESSPLQGLAKGKLLRAELDAHSHLSLRLRGVRITGAN